MMGERRGKPHHGVGAGKVLASTGSGEGTPVGVGWSAHVMMGERRGKPHHGVGAVENSANRAEAFAAGNLKTSRFKHIALISSTFNPQAEEYTN